MKSNNFDYILFDWDGCLAHSLPTWLKSYQIAFQKRNLTITDQQIIDLGVYNFEALKTLGIDDLDLFGKDIYNAYKLLLPDICFHVEAEDTLKKLKKQGIKMALVTSSYREVIDIQFERLGCNEYFECIMTWEDTENNKPHPEPLLTAMKKIGAKKETTLMIGDSEVDIIAAREAGIRSVWYYPTINQNMLPKKHFMNHTPDFTINNFEELFKII